MEGLFGGEGPQVQPVAVGDMHAFALACHQMISSPHPSITNVKVCGVAPTVAGRLPSRSPSLSPSRITASPGHPTAARQKRPFASLYVSAACGLTVLPAAG